MRAARGATSTPAAVSSVTKTHCSWITTFVGFEPIGRSILHCELSETSSTTKAPPPCPAAMSRRSSSHWRPSGKMPSRISQIRRGERAVEWATSTAYKRCFDGFYEIQSLFVECDRQAIGKRQAPGEALKFRLIRTQTINRAVVGLHRQARVGEIGVCHWCQSRDHLGPPRLSCETWLAPGC